MILAHQTRPTLQLLRLPEAFRRALHPNKRLITPLLLLPAKPSVLEREPGISLHELLPGLLELREVNLLYYTRVYTTP